MSIHFRQLAERVVADGAITADEILTLRRTVWPDGRICAEEAEALFAMNDRVAGRSAEWTDFFVEALTEFAVNGREPKGYVDEATAEWLIARIDHDGHVDTIAELELMVRVIEKALNVPDTLKAFVLAAIERTVLTGEGPTRGGELDAGSVNAAECALLRRVIFASGGDGPACVSKAETEMLFRLKDATLNAANTPEWQRLFVQGVANFLQAWRGAAPLSRERAGALESFMNDRSSSVAGFFGRVLRVDRDGFGSAMREMALGGAGNARDHAGEVRAASEVTEAEDLWLRTRMDEDDRIDALEQALLDFLKDDTRG